MIISYILLHFSFTLFHIYHANTSFQKFSLSLSLSLTRMCILSIHLAWYSCCALSCLLSLIFLIAHGNRSLKLSSISLSLFLGFNLSITRIKAAGLICTRHTYNQNHFSLLGRLFTWPWFIHRQHPLAFLIIRCQHPADRYFFFILSLFRSLSLSLSFVHSRFLTKNSFLSYHMRCARHRYIISIKYRRQIGTRADSSLHLVIIASELTHIHQLASAPSNLVVFVLCLIAF